MGSRVGIKRSVLGACSSLALLVACAHVPERKPLPEDGVEEATVFGIPRVRAWGDAPPPWDHLWLEESDEELQERYSGVYGKPHTYLAISGGGADGAFAAGLLLGWTAAGDRPEFTVVTGISAGALVAPFAFLGSEYDEVLRSVAVDLENDDVFERRRLLKAIRTDAFATTEPLEALIANYVDETLMEQIAKEHRKGRVLNVGTTNLDSLRPVIWSLGEIADSGHPKALELIRLILLASASMPAAFTPVMIPVEYDGEMYDELHVDGGTASQVFLYPAGVDLHAVQKRLHVPGRSKVYVIRNARLDPRYEAVDNRLVPISGRSISSVVRTQGIGDLYRIFLETCRDGLDFHLAYIPASFVEESESEFDPAYMTKLFDTTYATAKAGYPWERMPPELKDAPVRCR
ncbi:MAG: patatin-like phospholipase family protein [Myxococcota bacterium]